MASVFSLFGELKVGTSGFENSLYEAEARLNKTQRAITDTEKKAERLGHANARTGRSFEKLSDSVKANRDRMQQALDAYGKGEISQRRLESVLRQTDARIGSINGRLKDHAARLADMPTRADRFAQSLQRVNTYLTVGAGLLAGYAVKGALDLEQTRNKFTALEGSVEKANARIQQLLQLSRQNVGVNFDGALENFAQLNAITGISEQSILKMITALGKLDTAFQIDSQAAFGRNLTQIFTQGFERSDIKEAIGRVPIFEELVKSAFGTNDPAKLKELKESGKITIDSWLAGIAEAANNDARFAGLRETTGSKISKALTEINVATAPMVQSIFDGIQPEIDAALKGLQEQDYGAVGNAIGGVIGKGIGAGLRSAMAAETLDAASLEKFGQQILSGFNADSAGTAIKLFFNKVGMEVQRGIVDVSALVVMGGPVGAGMKLSDKVLESMGFDTSASANKQVQKYFRDTQSKIFAEYEKSSVDILQKAKQEYQKVADDSSLSDAIRTNARNQIAQIEKDIESAQQRAADHLARTGQQLGTQGVNDAINGAVSGAEPAASSGGSQIGSAIAQGMSSGIYGGHSLVINAAISLAKSAWQSAKDALGIQSPSKVFAELGKDTVQGFVVGVESKKNAVGAALKKAIASQIKDLQKELAGLNIENTILGGGQTTGLRNQIFAAEQIKSTLEDLLSIRQELGVNADKPLIAGPAALREIASLNGLKDIIGEIASEVRDFTQADAFLRMMDAFKDPQAARELQKQADTLGISVKNMERLVRIKAAAGMEPLGIDNIIDAGRFNSTGFGLGPGGSSSSPLTELTDEQLGATISTNLAPPPKLLPQWENFWATMRSRLDGFKNTLPSFKQAIGVNLIDSLYGIGDILGNAVARADGTLSGFFQSVAQGFRQMAQSILAELARIAVNKLISSLIGSIAGGFGGGINLGTGSGQGILSSVIGNIGFKAGGFTGLGGRMEPAGIVHRGEYVIPANVVKSVGVGFFDALIGNRMPAMAYGGYASPTAFVPNFSTAGSTTNNSTTTNNAPNVFNFNFHNSHENATFAKQSAEQAARGAMAQLNRTSVRNS